MDWMDWILLRKLVLLEHLAMLIIENAENTKYVRDPKKKNTEINNTEIQKYENLNTFMSCSC